jgi:hypothetical protein
MDWQSCPDQMSHNLCAPGVHSAYDKHIALHHTTNKQRSGQAACGQFMYVQQHMVSIFFTHPRMSGLQRCTLAL